MATAPATRIPRNAPSVPAAKLRRIALDAQGLLRQAPFGRGRNATRRAIEHLGYVQIDTISVVARAHDHVLHARVPNYRPEHLDALLKQRAIFEYWYHAASYLPMSDYRFALPRMRAMASKSERWIRSRDTRLMQEVLARIRAEGPLKARDFQHAGHNGSGWWDWKPAKGALEQLFMQGDLMVAGRDGFQKTYDLTERVLPAGTDTRPPDQRELARYLLTTMLRGHGYITPTCVTYLRRGKAIRTALKSVLDEEMAEGNLVTIRLPGGEVAYTDPERLESRSPPVSRRAAVLSPFDGLVIHRDRARSVFDYDYQIECYVPARSRRYGYFCLPLLHRDRLIGRADCKAHRDAGRFEVRHLHLEPHAEPVDELVDEAAAALRRFAAFNSCTDVAITRTTPATLKRPLQRALDR